MDIVNEYKVNWAVLALTRFFLASIVMMEHLKKFCDVGNWGLYTYFGAFEAILGFLLISGFSIGTSLEKDNGKDFLIRRGKRIYPVFLASIIFQALIVPNFWETSELFKFAINLFFLNQIFSGESFLGVSWTLSTEVWLYCLAPLLRKVRLNILFFLIGFSFMSYCLYTCGRTLFHWNYYSGTSFGINLILLSFIWISGFALALFPERRKIILLIIGGILIGHISITILIQSLYRFKHHEIELLWQIDTLDFVGKALCVILIYGVIAYNHKFPEISNTAKKLFKLLGDISYPLYLTHCTFFFIMAQNKVSNLYVMILGQLLLSLLIYYLFDFYSKRRDSQRQEALVVEKK
ncbi:acyltransferase family protein [Sporocytophaga myxococcoides]|uniref:acyltransferase family protein n=1 Tax=Sporocytophaga myxococcoides TaxID=153721 RepID=UPI00040603E9|nr:acyltransferase [Sporocytophaga myxococcoides]